MGLAAPAHAAPVAVTTTLTDPAGNGLDGWVEITRLNADGTFAGFDFEPVSDGLVYMSLEPGSYKFEFSGQDGLFVPEYYNNKTTYDTADVVPVTGTTSLDPVQLAPRPVATGQVLSPTGRPVSAEVEVYDSTDGSFVDSVSTDEDGVFKFGVAEGSYKVLIDPDHTFVAEWWNNKPSLETADLVTVGAAGANFGVITVTRGGSINGRVTNAAGAPLERVLVTAGGYSDYTDANGVYLIEEVPSGSYGVRFSDPAAEYLPEYYSDKATEATSDQVAVGVDQAVGGVDAVLANDPAAAVDPATVDMSGTVTDSAGAPVIAATVRLIDTPADPADRETVVTLRTNRAGQWFATQLNERHAETEYKVSATDLFDREEGQYYRLSRFFGGAQAWENAKPVAVPAAHVNITLPLTGGISGTITSEAALPVEETWVRVVTEFENEDHGYVDVEDSGTYLTTNLEPGKYKVLFGDSGTAGFDERHAGEWYDNTTYAKAKVVTVTSGKTTGSINAALGKDLKALRKPEIEGNPYIDGKVTAYPGVWTAMTGTTFIYEWLVDGKVVATGQSLSLGTSYKNEKVVLRVTAENGDLDGTALVTSQRIEKKPKVKVKVSGSSASFTIKGKGVKAKKIKGSVVVKRIKDLDAYGAPKYAKAGKAKFANGKGKVPLKKLKKGKNKLVFFFEIKGKLGDATVNKTVKVRRR
ncbi:hypothetical protein DDE18_02305 [Nocardioides gansuensis]|uniref:Uncharacterized protein n=2 Tax=Nocardioides gansuensis TaxID=2138300 RepID=A0A2T8FFH1_9ACTN|nr:hypothetical protein DDE18_02305 [Nocardioides gansuensis]